MNRKLGLILIVVLCLGILPTRAQTVNFIEVDNGSKTQYYKDSAGYDKLLKPDGSVLIYSQRYTVEYLSGKTWKQITTPYSVTQKDNDVTRHYTDYLGTTVQVIYHTLDDGSTKTDIVINSGADRVYRIVWSLDGITPNTVQYGENFIQFNNEAEWVRADWNDAYSQYGDISVPIVSDSANGKKLDVIFNVGTVKQGEQYILDPILFDSYSYTTYSGDLWIKDVHPSAAQISAVGQAFNATESGNIESATFYLKKQGTPTGYIAAYLYTGAGIYGTNMIPNGAALAVSEVFDSSTLTGVSKLVQFNFNATNQFSLVADTKYCIVLQGINASFTVANFVNIGFDGIGPTHAGNIVYYGVGAWDRTNPSDAIFYVSSYVPPQNTDLNADSVFSKDSPGWVNVTVSDLEVALLTTVDIQINTTGDSNSFTLRWTQTIYVH